MVWRGGGHGSHLAARGCAAPAATSTQQVPTGPRHCHRNPLGPHPVPEAGGTCPVTLPAQPVARGALLGDPKTQRWGGSLAHCDSPMGQRPSPTLTTPTVGRGVPSTVTPCPQHCHPLSPAPSPRVPTLGTSHTHSCKAGHGHGGGTWPCASLSLSPPTLSLGETEARHEPGDGRHWDGLNRGHGVPTTMTPWGPVGGSPAERSHSVPCPPALGTATGSSKPRGKDATGSDPRDAGTRPRPGGQSPRGDSSMTPAGPGRTSTSTGNTEASGAVGPLGDSNPGHREGTRGPSAAPWGRSHRVPMAWRRSQQVEDNVTKVPTAQGRSHRVPTAWGQSPGLPMAGGWSHQVPTAWG